MDADRLGRQSHPQGHNKKLLVAKSEMRRPTALSVVDEHGDLRDEVKPILDLVAEHDAVLSCGHLHISEVWPLFEEAKRRGCKRLLINHPTYTVGAAVKDFPAADRPWRLYRALDLHVHRLALQDFTPEHLKTYIDAAGVDRTFFGSDLGQANNPSPVEGFRQIIRLLPQLGYAKDEVRQMVTSMPPVSPASAPTSRRRSRGPHEAGERPTPRCFAPALLAGEHLVGTFIKTPTAHATEIIGALGFDFVVIDEEHAPFDRSRPTRRCLPRAPPAPPALVRPHAARDRASCPCSTAARPACWCRTWPARRRAREIARACRYRAASRGYSGSPRHGRLRRPRMWRRYADAADATDHRDRANRGPGSAR